MSEVIDDECVPMNRFTQCFLPPKGWWNLNFDASTLGSPNTSGIGAVIRDFEENVMRTFQGRVVSG